mgnify:CR=1 FL=1
MAIQKNTVINRKEYQNIRKMDHNQMNLYLQEIYKNGYTDGVKSVPDRYSGNQESTFGHKGTGRKESG